MRTSEPPPSPWEVWHARFNFDRRGYKFRPILVLSHAPSGLLAAMITSASNKLALPHDTPIKDWKQAGLTKPSLVRIDESPCFPHRTSEQRAGSAGYPFTMPTESARH